MLRHFGILKNTSKKVAIVFHVCPGTSDKALVCDLDSLPPRLSDMVDALLKSKEAQTGPFKEFYHLLARRISPESRIPLINELHNKNYLFATPHDNVLVMPKPSITIPLSRLISELRNMGVNFDQEKLEENLNKSAKEENNVLSNENVNNSSKEIKNVPENKENLETFLKENYTIQNVEESNVDEKVEDNVFVDNKIQNPENIYTLNIKKQEIEEKSKIAASLLKSAENALSELTRYLEKALAHDPNLENFIRSNYNNIADMIILKHKKEKEAEDFLYKREKVVTSSAFKPPKVARPVPKRGRPIKNK